MSIISSTKTDDFELVITEQEDLAVTFEMDKSLCELYCVS